MGETYRWLELFKPFILGNVCPKKVWHEVRTKPKDAAFAVHYFTPGLEFTLAFRRNEQDPSTIRVTNALHPPFNSTLVDKLDSFLIRVTLTRCGRLAFVSGRAGLRLR